MTIHRAKPVSCKWTNHYNKLIERALNRTLDQYTESHHIKPVCIGGSNDKSNLVNLTPEEHFTAHLLLCKIYPEINSLLQAVHMMTVDSPTTPRKNKMYGWVKRKLSTHNSNRMKIWHMNNIHPMQGKKHSEEIKKQISESSKGRNKTPIHMYTKDGQFIKSFDSLGAASDELLKSVGTIWSAANSSGFKTAGGFKFSYDKLDLLIEGHKSRSKRKMFSWTDEQKSMKGIHK